MVIEDDVTCYVSLSYAVNHIVCLTVIYAIFQKMEAVVTSRQAHALPQMNDTGDNSTGNDGANP